MTQFFAKLFNFADGISHQALIYNYRGRRKSGDDTITAYSKTVLIYNSQAGKLRRDAGRRIERAAAILTRKGHNTAIIPTTGPGSAGPIARREIVAGADLIVVAGGDGTINEAAEGIVHSAVPLAILPAGTANVLACEMKLGSNVERAAERLDELRPRRISVGRVTCDSGRISRHFLLMAGIGLDAQVVYEVSAGLKARAGKAAYWVAGWSLLGRRLPQLRVDVDGLPRECSFALISKVRNYGGDFRIATSVSLFDDQFEIILFEGRSTLPYVKYFGGLLTNRLSGMKGVTILRAGHAVMEGPSDARVYVQIDGEVAGHLPAEVRIVPDALTLLVPGEYGQ